MSRHPDSGDRLAAAHAHLVRAVEDLASSDAWRRMLDMAARFPTYSVNNVLLIGAQRPDATRVAGLRTWNAVGRHVRKGEKGIAILAPCLYRPRDPESTAARRAVDADRPTGSPGPEGEAVRRLRGFRIVYVWDLAQTDGRPLDDVSPAEVRAAAPPELIGRLSAALTEDGYTVERGPCGAAYGYTDFKARTVRVRADVPDGQAAKTLAHELGHVRADHEHRFLAGYATSAGCRAQAEVEAESIAYVVTSVAGMHTEGYSVPYVAGWAGGDSELVRTAATCVLTAARGIVHDLGIEPSPVAAPERPAAAVGLPAGRAPTITDPATR